MICQKCQSQNVGGSQFCGNCGTNLYYPQRTSDTQSDVSGIALMAFIAITFVCTFLQFAIQTLVPEWYVSPMKRVLVFLWLTQNTSFILPALAIKNTTMKIIGLILTSVLIAYWIYLNAMFLMR